MDPYITVVNAQAYFDDRLNTEAWDDATATNKLKALKMATNAFERLNYAGELADSDQDQQFPRGDDATIPADMQNACAEEALALLDGKDPEMESENLRMLSQAYSGTKANYNGNVTPVNIVAGIMSVIAWRLTVPFLRDYSSMYLNRET